MQCCQARGRTAHERWTVLWSGGMKRWWAAASVQLVATAAAAVATIAGTSGFASSDDLEWLGPYGQCGGLASLSPGPGSAAAAAAAAAAASTVVQATSSPVALAGCPVPPHPPLPAPPPPWHPAVLVTSLPPAGAQAASTLFTSRRITGKGMWIWGVG